MSSFWSHCLSHFERELSSQQFATWFRVLSAEETDSTVTVMAPIGAVIVSILWEDLRPQALTWLGIFVALAGAWVTLMSKRA